MLCGDGIHPRVEVALGPRWPKTVPAPVLALLGHGGARVQLGQPLYCREGSKKPHMASLAVRNGRAASRAEKLMDCTGPPSTGTPKSSR